MNTETLDAAVGVDSPRSVVHDLVDLIDRPARLLVEDAERRLFVEANMDPQYAVLPRPFTVDGIVIAVDADDTLRGGGSVIVRDADDGYRIVGLADVVSAQLWVIR
jgi:hypothetical protein